jgi:hypothetical protein
VGADFVWRMENVLDLYAKPRDPQRPVVCLDEQPRPLIAELSRPVPAAADRLQGPPPRHGHPVPLLRAIGRLTSCRGDGAAQATSRSR